MATKPKIGKLHPRLLAKYIFKRTGKPDPKVIVGPAYGEDSAIIDIGQQVLVAHVDPITEAVERIGWLAVNIVCNDIAVRGAKPRWLLAVLYLPEACPEKIIDEITAQMDKAAKQIGAMIVGGHTEYTPRLDRPLIAMTALGLTQKNKYITTSGAKPGDLIIMTKGAAIEGTAILATDFKRNLINKGIPKETIEKARKFIEEISVIPEALTLAEIGVNSMHDPTEGGLLGGLTEIAHASNVQLEVWEEKILIREETKQICEALNLNPLKLIGSGALIATIPKENVEKAKKALKQKGIRHAIIGQAKEGKGLTLHKRDGTTEQIGEYVEEELLKLWAEA